jgi:anaerobic selenocysteine-containing dehydrogenase
VGTVTNLEGRVSALNAKLVAPGSAWPDVAIAAELAEEFGQSLGMSSVVDAARAIEETTGYPALSVLEGSSDEVVIGRAATTTARRPLDPIAFPGIRSIETSGLSERASATTVEVGAARHAPAGVAWDQVSAGRGVDVPHPDAYAWRVYASRRLYDRGVAMQGSPALAALVAPTVLGLHQLDLDRLGVADGDEVVAVGPRGEARLRVTRDDAVARGVVEVAYSSLAPDGSDVVRSWLRAGDLAAEIGLEAR